MKFNNQSGSVLIITLCFVLVFTLLGIASINFAGVQNEFTSKQVLSNMSFWLADAGVERAKDRVRKLIPLANADDPIDIDLGSGFKYYDVYYKEDPDCPQCQPNTRWLIHSCGAVSNNALTNLATWCDTDHLAANNADNNQVRTIEAIIAKFNIDNAYTSEGPIDKYTPSDAGCMHGDAQTGIMDGGVLVLEGGTFQGEIVECDELIEENVVFDFETVFNGEHLNTVVGQAVDSTNPALDRVYDATDQNSLDGKPISDITVVNLADGLNKVQFDTGNIASGETPFLIFISQGTGTTEITFNGTDNFEGIIWGEGNIDIKKNGTADILGSVFIHGGDSSQSKLSGNLQIYYDADSIEGALGNIDFTNDSPSIIAWKEI